MVSPLFEVWTVAGEDTVGPAGIPVFRSMCRREWPLPRRQAIYARASPTTRSWEARMARRLDAARLGDHLDRLYRAAWALCGSREDAEDLVQETYARILARPRVLRREDDLGYLLRALRVREGTVMSRLYRARQQVVRRIESGSA